MTTDREDQSIILDEKSKERPKEKGHVHPAVKKERKEEQMQEVREKSGF